MHIALQRSFPFIVAVAVGLIFGTLLAGAVVFVSEAAPGRPGGVPAGFAPPALGTGIR